jgi:hypothetical protein
MPSAKKTPNYNLTQYADNGTDKVSFMGDYNSDMAKVDTALHDKADKATTYSKTDVDTQLTTKADTATTYSKSDVDSRLSSKANSSDVYTKTQSDSNLNTGLDLKANSSDVYTKTQSNSNLNTGLDLKADKTSVYTTSQIDTKIGGLVPKDTRTEIVWIGDSFSTGYQPSGSVPQAQRIPYVCASALGLNPHVYGNNASGFVKTGDGNLTINDMANQAAALTASTRAATKYVVVYAGFNDTADANTAIANLGNGVDVCFNVIKNAYPNAEIHYAFNCGENGLTTGQGKARFQITAQIFATHPEVVYHEDITWSILARTEMAYDGDDPHPAPTGQIFLGNNWANILQGGSAVNYYASQVTMSGGLSGNISYAASGPNLTIMGKGGGSAPSPGAVVATLPNCFALGDGFLIALVGAGAGQAFWHLDGGQLVYTGMVGNGASQGGNWWLEPKTFTTGSRLS